MNLMKKLLLLFLVSFSFIVSAYADSRNFSFKVNNTNINVRMPDGFYESSYINPEALDMAKTFYPDYLNVHAVLMPKGISDTERLSRYIILVTDNNIAKRKLSQKDFNDLREVMREQQFTLMNELRENINEEIDAGASRISKKYAMDYIAEIGETIPLGVFIDNEKVMSINTIMNMSASANGISSTYLQVGSTSFVFVKNKVIFVYIYSDFDSEKDIVWIEGKTKELVNLLTKNN